MILLIIKYSLVGIGTLTNNHYVCDYRARKLNELIEFVKIFDTYPLISRKKGDYILFK